MQHMRLTAILLSLFLLFATNVEAQLLKSSNPISGIGSSTGFSMASSSGLNPSVLKLALNAYNKAQRLGLGTRKHVLTIIDYSMAAHKKRLWIYDLDKKKVILNTLVAHGKNSGGVYANNFSNKSRALTSSVGLYLTGGSYYGSKGYAMRLKGLENGFNSNASSRAIVMHGAWYVNEDVARRYGKVGRSWGCPSVSPKMARPVIDTIKNGTLLFIYGKDRQWLNSSRFLQA